MSSETEYPSGNSITSSHSSFNHCTQVNSVINSKNNSDKSDSFIVFEESQSSNPVISKKYDSISNEKSSHLLQSRGSADIRKTSSKTSKVYLYIQMQLCQKNSLREWLCDNLDRDQKTVLQMFYEIVQAVEYVHLQGLIHRDLKVSLNVKSAK